MTEEFVVGRKRIAFLLRVAPETVSRFVARGLLHVERFGATTPLRANLADIERLHREIHGTDLKQAPNDH